MNTDEIAVGKYNEQDEIQLAPCAVCGKVVSRFVVNGDEAYCENCAEGLDARAELAQEDEAELLDEIKMD